VLDAGGVIRYTQVGFEAGDEKRYAKEVEAALAAGDPEDKSELPDQGPEEGARVSPRVPWWPDAREPRRLLFTTASSTDAPHRAVLPLVFAVAAKEKGHDAVLFLAGDATLLMKPGVADGTKAAGQPDASTLLRRTAELGIPIFL